jgi:hypothetical protein
MRSQPTPVVDMDDVERVVRRDYPADKVADILREIDATNAPESARVVLACLKLAKGDLRRLQGDLRNASGWYREILSDAEYPLATKRWSRMGKMTDQERSSIYERDWNQYVAWLGRNADWETNS